MEITQSTAIQIVFIALAMLGLSGAMFYFFARAEGTKIRVKKHSSFITLAGIAIVFATLWLSYATDRKNSLFATLSCEVQERYAPAKITCINNSEIYEGVKWFVNDTEHPGLDESFETVVEQPGKYVIKLAITDSVFFSTNKANASEVVVVGKREEFERDIYEVFRFSSSDSFIQTYTVDSPSGYFVRGDSVQVNLQIHRGEAHILETKIEENVVSVTINGVGKIEANFINIKKVPTEGSVSVSYTAEKRL